MNIRATMLCLTVAAAPCAFAQTPKLPGTGPDFVNKAMQDGLTEVELGKMALMKSSNPDIKTFANRMVQDHSKANMELAEIAKKDGIPVSNNLDSRHAAMLKQMSEKSGADFDTSYTSDMLNDHQKAIALFQNEATDDNHDLASFASSTLPTLRQHQQMAQQLSAETAQLSNGVSKPPM
jgi:putative membrane protein